MFCDLKIINLKFDGSLSWWREKYRTRRAWLNWIITGQNVIREKRWRSVRNFRAPGEENAYGDKRYVIKCLVVSQIFSKSAFLFNIQNWAKFSTQNLNGCTLFRFERYILDNSEHIQAIQKAVQSHMELYQELEKLKILNNIGYDANRVETFLFFQDDFNR